MFGGGVVVCCFGEAVVGGDQDLGADTVSRADAEGYKTKKEWMWVCEAYRLRGLRELDTDELAFVVFLEGGLQGRHQVGLGV